MSIELKNDGEVVETSSSMSEKITTAINDANIISDEFENVHNTKTYNYTEFQK